MLSNSEWIQQLALSTVPQSIDQTNAFIKQNKKFEREQKRKYNLTHYGNSTGMSDKWQQGLSSVNNFLGGYTNSDLSGVASGADSLLNVGMSLTPGLLIANTARQGLRTVNKLTGIDNKYVDFNTSEELGLSKWASAGNQALNLLGVPGLTKITKSASLLDKDKAMGGFSNVTSINQNLTNINGRTTFGAKSLNNLKTTNNTQVEQINDLIIKENKKASNYFPQISLLQNQMIYNGHMPGNSFVINSKHGGTIPELEKTRSIIQSLQSKKQEIQEPQKFQLGGKMNMIVTGALHARKHNLEELNPNLEGEITKKGIPVVVMNEGGEVNQQMAEVESQELVLQIDTTKTIEDYYDEYNSTDSKTEKNKIALECGKYLVDELLKNTDDPDKLIKKTV